MTISRPNPPPGRYFLLFDICTGLFLLSAAFEISGAAPSANALVTAAWMLILLVLFFRKGRDEFAEHCWRRATSATFVMLIAAPLAWAFGEGVVDGFTGRPMAQEYQPSFDAVVMLLFATFFASFQWTRFRGGAA